jgi:hypothetical protein
MLNPYAPQEVDAFAAILNTLLGRIMLAQPEWSSGSRVTIERVVREESEVAGEPEKYRAARFIDTVERPDQLRWKVRVGNFESTRADIGLCLHELEEQVHERLREVRAEHEAEVRRIDAIRQALESGR